MLAMNTDARSGHRGTARAFAAAVAGAGGLIAVRFAVPAGTPRIRPGGRAGSARGIAVLEKVRIGESDQWVLERSEDVDNPVVLYLHGGPGTSQLTSNRRNTRYLEKFFTVVKLGPARGGKVLPRDQRCRPDEHRPVRGRHQGTDPVSAGKVRPGAARASRPLMGDRHRRADRLGLPELYSCYVGIGQVANMAEGEAASYQWTLGQARKHQNRRVTEALVTMGPPPYQGNWQKKTVTQRRYLGRFGGEVHAGRTGAFGLVIGGLLVSREYTLAD